MLILSFDCATKTFAFCAIKYIKGFFPDHFENIHKDLKELKLEIDNLEKIENFSKCEELTNRFNEICQRFQNNFSLIDFETKNLFPGKKDREISSVERVKSAAAYIKKRIMPLISDESSDVLIIIEYQMGPNANARTIADAIIALFCDYETIVIKPHMKNKEFFTEAGKMENFYEKYSSNYEANKAQTKYNFNTYLKIFPSDIKITKSEIGHVADAFMQAMSVLKNPDTYKISI